MFICGGRPDEDRCTCPCFFWLIGCCFLTTSQTPPLPRTAKEAWFSEAWIQGEHERGCPTSYITFIVHNKKCPAEPSLTLEAKVPVSPYWWEMVPQLELHCAKEESVVHLLDIDAQVQYCWLQYADRNSSTLNGKNKSKARQPLNMEEHHLHQYIL